MVGLQLSNLVVGYDQRAVAGPWSADIGQGSILAVVGANGSGKSTLLRVMAGLARPMQGQVLLGGRSLHSLPEGNRCRCVAYVDQQPTMATRLSAEAVIQLGAWRGGAGVPSPASRVESVIGELGLSGLESVPWQELSEGQRHRVAIARALVQCTEGMLVLDEPFAALDSPSAVLVARALRARAQEGVIVVASVHDVCLARSLATTVARLGTGSEQLRPWSSVTLGTVDDMLSGDALTVATGVPHWSVVRPDGSRSVGPDWPGALREAGDGADAGRK